MRCSLTKAEKGAEMCSFSKREKEYKKTLQLYFLAAPKTLLKADFFLGEIAKVKSDLLVHQIMILKNLSGAPPT